MNDLKGLFKQNFSTNLELEEEEEEDDDEELKMIIDKVGFQQRFQSTINNYQLS